MKIYQISLFLLFLFNLTNAQQNNIIGKTDKQEIISSVHNTWYSKNYNAFKPKAETLKTLNQLFDKNNFKIDVYFGSWCSDSQRELPKLMKILEHTKFDLKNLNLIGVDRDKIVPGLSEQALKKLNITNVPTIIVYKNGKEINRFVEYPQESLEEDLIKILSNQEYKHSYQF